MMPCESAPERRELMGAEAYCVTLKMKSRPHEVDDSQPPPVRPDVATIWQRTLTTTAVRTHSMHLGSPETHDNFVTSTQMRAH